MLFSYKYVNHDIEKIQKFLDFLFYDVWVIAEGDFDVEKLNGNPELKGIYIDFGNVDYDPESNEKFQKGRSANFFNTSIEKIFQAFADIDDDDFKLGLIDYYSVNNDIENLCGNKLKVPISYLDIKNKYPDLEKVLRQFYYSLYSTESPFNLKAFGELNKSLLPSHYRDFMTVNNEEICPFCGILPLKGNNHSYKEAYDHYLPKGIYPFNSLNFRNLVPICHECNSTYKLSKEPIYDDYRGIDPLLKENKRQFSFYPYSDIIPNIEFNITLKTKNIQNIKRDDIELEVVSHGFEEQIDSWKRVYGIEERYLALLCKKHGAKAWYFDVSEYYENASVLSEVQSANDYYDKVIKSASRNINSGEDRLKVKFLEECRNIGLLQK
jgi:hypothetical protein